MKKTFVLIFLIVVIVIGFCVGWLLAKEKNINAEANVKIAKENSEKKKSILMDDYQVYDILGTSKNLSDLDRTSMTKWREDMKMLAQKNQQSLYLNGFKGGKKVALTFDDGPDNAITSEIATILKENGVKGTFFFIGDQVKKHSKTAKTISDEGNLVLSHSFNHIQLSKLTEDKIKEQIVKGEEEIYKATGKKTAMIRPPYGDVNEKVLKVAKDQGYKVILWSIDTLDWSQKEKTNIIDNAVSNLRDGEIILMHSNSDKKETAKALPELIKKIKSKGYSIVTLDQIIKEKAYKN